MLRSFQRAKNVHYISVFFVFLSPSLFLVNCIEQKLTRLLTFSKKVLYTFILSELYK